MALHNSDLVFPVQWTAQGDPYFPPARKADGAEVSFRGAVRSTKGDRFELVLRKVRTKRSSKANRYYFGAVIRAILLESGEHESRRYEIHDALAFKFLPLPPCPLTGSPRRMRTPDTDSAEFSAYVNQVKLYACTELFPGLEIPEAERIDVGGEFEDARAWDVRNHRGVKAA